MPNDVAQVLSAAQIATLRRLTQSRRSPSYLAHRATVVLDEHRARTIGAEREAGVSRQTARKWFRRFVEQGVAGLEDAPRTGRPQGGASSTEERVLVAPLFAESASWTSRSVATVAECTQSAVARVWKRRFDEARTNLGQALPAGGLEVVACFTSHAGCALLFRRRPEAPTVASAFMRSALRPPLQTVLATERLTTLAGHGLDAFLSESTARFGDDDPPDHAICSSPEVAENLHAILPGLRVVLVDRDDWQGLLLDVGPRLSGSSRESLTRAQHRAMDWARSLDGPFVWVDSPATRAPAPTSRRGIPLATSEHVADSIVTTLQREILAGRLGGGDRITESYLARSVHTSRGHVRDALRLLESRGIVELHPNRGAVVPRPGLDDVVETYAARRALGALIVRRVAESTAPGHLDAAERALARMLEVAQNGDAWATGEEDFRFQEALAAGTGMRRVPAMFFVLSAQLRLFVAVLGLRYAYSIPDMCRDDVELMTLIRQHKATEAVSRWNAKMNDAATYMISQLEPGPASRAGRSAL